MKALQFVLAIGLTLLAPFNIMLYFNRILPDFFGMPILDYKQALQISLVFYFVHNLVNSGSKSKKDIDQIDSGKDSDEHAELGVRIAMHSYVLHAVIYGMGWLWIWILGL